MSVRSDMLKATQPIVDDLLKLPGSFITGSYAIGGDNDESDIDVAVPIYSASDCEVAYNVSEYGLDKELSHYNNGVKIFKTGRYIPINIVTLHPFEYCAWLFATNTMAGMQPITDKHTRHRVFETFCFAYKLANPNSDTITVVGACAYCESHKPTTTMKTIIDITTAKERGVF